jgi:hypothetical protein
MAELVQVVDWIDSLFSDCPVEAQLPSVSFGQAHCVWRTYLKRRNLIAFKSLKKSSIARKIVLCDVEIEFLQ